MFKECLVCKIFLPSCYWGAIYNVRSRGPSPGPSLGSVSRTTGAVIAVVLVSGNPIHPPLSVNWSRNSNSNSSGRHSSGARTDNSSSSLQCAHPSHQLSRCPLQPASSNQQSCQRTFAKFHSCWNCLAFSHYLLRYYDYGTWNRNSNMLSERKIGTLVCKSHSQLATLRIFANQTFHF